MFILKCSRYSETTLNYYNELSTSPWKSICTVSVCSDAQDIYKLYLAVIPSQIRSCARDKLWDLRTRRTIQRGPNIVYRLPLLLPGEAWKTTIQVLFCATCTILHNKNGSSALFSSIKVTFFLRIFLKRIEKTHLKSPVFTKCLLVWLYMESVGNVGVWCVSSNPLSALPKECRWKTKTV